LQISRCPACNAPVPPGTGRCAYCGQYLIHDDPAQRGHGATAGPIEGATTLDTPEGTIIFRRVREPNEGAFSLLIPQGWQIRGGIQRAHQAMLNPFTNEPETGSNQWQYRWVTESGEEFYTDNEDHDPNVWGLLNASDWRRTAVRPR
jgi:hypothetical protein